MKKKFLLPLLAVMIAFTTGRAEESDLSQFTDAVYVQSKEVPRGTQQTLSIQMKNSISVQTIQFDLYLPDGLTVVRNEDSELMTASKERISKFKFFDSSVQEDGAIRLLATAAVQNSDETVTNIAVGEGEIATIMVSVDADKALGDYPISIKNILLVSRDNVEKRVEEVTTKITVTEFDDHIVFDENSTDAPEASDGAVNVRVLRTIKANSWSTICLPFAMTEEQVQETFVTEAGGTVQLADFTGCEKTMDGEDIVGITVNFSNVTAIEANHPYIIKVSTAIDHDNGFTVNNIVVNPSEELKIDKDESKVKIGGKWYYFYNSFIGTYIANTEVPENTLFLSDNKFWYSNGETKMKAFRAYFDFYDILSSVVENENIKMSMFVDGESTRIDGLLPETSNDAIYDLTGRKVEKAEKGIYIVNGKKVLVK